MQPSAPSPASSPAPSAAPRFDERLTAPRSWWVIVGLLGLSGGLIMFPLGTVPMLGGLIVAAVVAGVAVSSYGSARIRVVSGSLVAGDARIPVEALGAAETLDAEEARAWRTYKADPRAFMLMRSYVPKAVRVEVTDPADPTPYVYLSSREPEALVAALEAERA
ncbi:MULTISPECIES: DUF3093 domain-containing protein [Streptomyces]|jgi:hypothetical protein|uniref:DUF3093 domain-containing protein n=1 Tax=Streptomyces nymphaeiformis TaxID=2663842 RepID=A0A7W7U518_9ACTN|nr:DUF3093 domain-containing protein [Streptomyces nymphaeiformis]MBB4985223.1 hypothetical protein [Streptomyces nymphaeiformis]